MYSQPREYQRHVLAVALPELVTLEAIIFDFDDTLIPDEANVMRALRATCDPVAAQYGIDLVI